MEKEKVMKHAAQVTEFQERMFDFIEESFRDDAELQTKQKTEQFWEQLHYRLEIEEEQESALKTEIVEKTEKIEEPVQQASNQIIEEKIMIDQSGVLSTFLNINIRILFLVIMSINIIWMQYLSMKYGSRLLILVMKWMMIMVMVCYMIYWIKPYRRVFWKKRTHD